MDSDNKIMNIKIVPANYENDIERIIRTVGMKSELI